MYEPQTRSRNYFWVTAGNTHYWALAQVYVIRDPDRTRIEGSHPCQEAISGPVVFCQTHLSKYLFWVWFHCGEEQKVLWSLEHRDEGPNVTDGYR